MSDDGLKVLQQWADEKVLNKGSLSSDGKSLSLEESDTTLDASKAYDVSYQSKSCRYTLASLFLQIINPTQGLMPYRNSCKKHNVSDPVKALDKPIVVGLLLGEEEKKEEAEVKAEPPQEQKKKKEDDRHRKRREEHRHHHKRKERSDKKPSSSKEKKKRKAPITDEQLFSNLNVVVDKRSQGGTEEQEVQAALSTEGFMITKEDLDKHKEETEQILQMEIPVGNSASILRSSSSERRDFSRVLELYLEATKPPKSDSKKHQQQAKRSQGPDRSHLIGKKPVIIVPKGMTSPITMVNAHEFFANSRFIPRDVQLKKAGRGPPQTSFSRKITARLGGGNVEYELMDNPKSKLGENPKEWQRVVAVIALGASWQFKDWIPKYANPVHLFSRTFGFYIGMEGDPIPQELLGWSVKKGKLNRDKRGLDSVTFASFWNGLDEWMAIHKRELMPQDDKKY